MELFPDIVVSSLWICSGLRKLRMEMANIKNIAHLMNRGMLGAGELCVTFHNYNAHWEDRLERH